MPRLSIDELNGWIAEFRAREGARADDVSAIDLSWDSETIDTALVVTRLATSGTEVLLQREIGGSPDWTVVFQPREHDAPASVSEMQALAEEVSLVARLVGYLSERTAQHVAEMERRDAERAAERDTAEA